MAGDKLWLRDFLAPKLPNARILLFGYNSNVTSDANAMHIGDHAANLLNRLEYKRTEDPERPIVFVAHSLGGLVVKKALVEAKLNKHYDPIRSATYGISFFATPHLGGNYAALGKILSDIVNATLRNPPNTLVRDLQKSSPFLGRLNEDFRHQLEDYHFVNFFETRYSGGLDIIVDRESAQLGLSGSREVLVPFDADHNNICKFATENSDYEQVEQNVMRLVEGALTTAAGRERRRSSASPFFGSPRRFSEPQFSSPALSSDGFSSTDMLGHYGSPIFEVPHNKNRNFVGRQDIVQRVVDHLTSNNEAHYRIALYGLGGVGKTDLAIQCAYTIGECYPDTSVFWIQASSFEHSHQSIVKIASALKIPGTDTPNANVFGLFRDYLWKGHRGRWVMIIDHADDFQSLTLTQGDSNTHIRLQSKRLLDYIPDCSHGSVLLTTRNKKVATSFADKDGLEQVLPLSRKESEQLVHQLLDTEQCREGGVDELTEVLNHFPLAIVQATSFIRGNGITVQTYLQRYRENKHDALELFGHGLMDSDDSDAVTTTWMISFKQLQANNQYAANLFSLMAYLDHSEIPESLLRDIDNKKTGLEFEKACGELKAFSLISEAYSIPSSASSSPNSIPRLFNVQPIVQLVMRLWLREHNQTTRWSDAALVAVSKTFPPAESSKEHWKAYEMYLPHVQAVLDHMDESTDEQQYKANLLHNVSWYFRVRGFHDTAARMGLEALAIRKQILGDEDEATLAGIHNLSRILFEQGKIEESEHLQIPAIEICKRNFGDEHKDTLRSQGHLANIRGMQGRYEEALELQESILEISERTMGQCPATWLAMRDLAITLSYIDHKTEAEELQLKVYDARREYLGEDHPETLIIMSDLATTYIEQSRFQEAEVLLKKVLERSKRILGERHPHTIAAYEDLKEVLKGQRKTDHVRRLEEVIRRIQREWKKSEETARVRKKPNVKRNMSSSVVTYAYRRPTATLGEEDEDDKSEMGGKDAEGLGLGLTLTNSRSATVGESEDEEEDEDDVEREEFETIKKALVLMMRGMMSLPVFNIVKVAPAEEPIPQSILSDAPQRTSISTPHLNSVENAANELNQDFPAQVQPASEVTASKSDATLTTSSSEKPAYSNNKFIRTIEKKVERNINKETRDALVKEGMDMLETTKTKWKKTNFRDLKVSWASGVQDKKEKQDEAGTDAETGVEREK
ncbi:hypothetical protein K469DRAFT_676405 [Zopfia rhizophila CBS 207.26]|uniref:DUF676 domain-containing protein n=1 Tax=Zopfia rhizophila CBS 207.26 TaxID=1314779 RepID=A0A6A6DIK7_9PEZI|nr:hypothetical protein K469DRAFT_676405 [Zopfia rhizophila CBS 207.26]